MESNNILVGKYRNFKILINDGCGCIFSLDENGNVYPLLFHPGTPNRDGVGLTQLKITSLKDITWYYEIFDYNGFDFEDLVAKHPLWITPMEKTNKFNVSLIIKNES